MSEYWVGHERNSNKNQMERKTKGKNGLLESIKGIVATTSPKCINWMSTIVPADKGAKNKT